MMEFKFVLPFLLLLVINSNAKKLPLVESRPYVMSLSLELKEEKVVDFIIDSLFATSGWKNSDLYCNVQLSDVLSIIPFKKTSTIDLNNAITQHLHLEITDDKINNFVQGLDYTTLSFMGLNVGSVYKNFVKTYLATDPTRIMDVLNVLGIGQDFAVAYAFGKESDMFAALQKGNFSLAALTEIETLLNATFNLKDLIKVLGIKKLNPLYLHKFINQDLTNYLGSKGPHETDFVNFLNSFMLEADDYKDIKSFKMCYKELTQNVALGVAISQNEIITNDFQIYESYNYLKNYLDFKIISVQTKTPYLFSSIEASDVFNKVIITGVVPQYIETTTSYDAIDTKMCTYVTIGTKKLMEQPVTARMVGNELKIAKTFMTTFKMGSPLICDGILYGLAATENLLSINFDVFEAKGVEQIESGELMNALNNLFEEFGIDPCDYFSCIPSDSVNGGFVVVPPVEGNLGTGNEDLWGGDYEEEYYDFGEESYGEEDHEEENNGEINKIDDVEDGIVNNENVQELEEAQVGENQPTEDQVVEEQDDVGQQPVEQQVVEENPVQEQAGQEELIDQQVVEEHGEIVQKPDEQQVVEEIPLKKQVVQEQPSDEQPQDESLVKEYGVQEQSINQQVIGEQDKVGEQSVGQQHVEEHPEVGEQPVDQQIAAEQVEVGEQPVDQLVQKEQAEVGEQPVDQEVVGEQAEVGEQPVDQQVVEEQVEVGEQQVVEENPVEEQIVEEQAEVAEQQVVEEKPVEEQPIEEQPEIGQQLFENSATGEEQPINELELINNNINEQVIDDQQVITEQVIPQGENVDDAPCVSDQFINEVKEEEQYVDI